MSDRESAIFSRCDTKMPGMFGSKPFMFKRPKSERRLIEGALRRRGPSRSPAPGASVASFFL